MALLSALKKLFGDNVHVFFTEPTTGTLYAVGMASGLQNKVCVKDFGLSGLTHADGLAVWSFLPGFVGGVMEQSAFRRNVSGGLSYL